jgi:hypothetical protein
MYDENRIVEVKALNPDGKIAGAGSGYLVAPRLVLTAWHVVRSGQTIQLRIYRDFRKSAGTALSPMKPAIRVWPIAEADEENDFALLKLDASEGSNDAPVQWIPLPSSGRHPIYGIGFPDHAITWNSRLARLLGLAPFRQRETYPIAGEFIAGGGLKGYDEGVGTFDVIMTEESLPEGSIEGWEGVSGSALFDGDRGHLLLGVVRDAARVRSHHRLKALPVARLFGREDVQRVIAREGLISPRRAEDGATNAGFDPSYYLHRLDREPIGKQIGVRIKDWSQVSGFPLFLALRGRQDDDLIRLFQRFREVDSQDDLSGLLLKEIPWPEFTSDGLGERYLAEAVSKVLVTDTHLRQGLLSPSNVKDLLPDGSRLFVYSLDSDRDC